MRVKGGKLTVLAAACLTTVGAGHLIEAAAGGALPWPVWIVCGTAFTLAAKLMFTPTGPGARPW